MKELSPRFLSEFCTELALLVHAGMPVSEGLELMRDDGGDGASGRWLTKLSALAGSERLLSDALEACGGAPDYLIDTVRLGERAGKLDEALSALGLYYERLSYFTEGLRRALTYPLLLILLMAAVFVVLIGYVLPIFNEAFAQAGVELSQTALLLLNLGRWLSSAGAALLAGLAVFSAAVALLYRLPGTAQATKRRLIRVLGGERIARDISGARFAMALAMAVSAGIDMPRALELAKDVAGDGQLTERAEQFEQALARGESFEESLKKSGLFSVRDSRLLVLGMKTGRLDEQMSQIAEKSELRVLDALEDRLRRVEPTLVILLSFLVGVILFSVMLPLMGIMSALG